MKVTGRFISPFTPVHNAICTLLLLVVSVWNCKAQSLQFNSNDSLMSKRTSYVVFANKPPTFKDRFIISFDLSLWDNDHLGYVFNITDTHNNSYSLTYIYNHNGSPTLNFNIDSKSNKIEIPLQLSQLKKRHWIPVKVDINLTANTVAFLVNGKWYKAKEFGFEQEITPTITFGRNPHYSDVPKMALKDLEIGNEDEKYFFPLNEWKGSAVHDKEGDAIGYVDHPSWLINESYFWTPKFQRTFNDVAGLNFDAEKQNLFVFEKDRLLQYNVQDGVVSEKSYKNTLPIKLVLGKSVVNTNQHKVYAYEALPADSNQSIAALDLSTLTWQLLGKGSIRDQRHHHNSFFDRDQKELYLFGGYGSFQYHKDLFKYDQALDKWQKLEFKGDTITPRFFSGSSQADNNNEVYVFGGYGNQSGNQIVGGTHYYDLYRLNLTTHTIKKLWQITPAEEPFVSANNLIISKDKKYFYALCYPHEKPKTNLGLYKFSIKDGSYEIVSGTIPVTSERIESDFNLFYDATQDIFICTAQEFTSPTQSTIRILTLSGPPVTTQAYLEAQKPEEASTGKYWWYAVAAAATAGGVAYLLWKKKSKPAVADAEEQLVFDPSSRKKAEKKPNAVYLLGEFNAYNKAGKDITYLFSPKIKQLFILILLNSREGEGVISKKISFTLWPEKDVTKTKNIRGVTLNHLRNILADFDGIELTFINDTYRFQINEGFYCDYFVISSAIDQVHQHDLTTEAFVNGYFDLFSRGSLLKELPETWLDNIKLEFEELLLQVLLPEVKRIYEAGDHKRALELSRIALTIDPFNDVALKYKLKSLRRIKGVDTARRVYDEFAAEYQKSLDSEYHVPFEKICR
ncbi:hypothetical protein DYU05_00385 [Mucilaginibacter terrenus]|uniref:Galactose oxidase n=1 Tax=Mucilaginibacter terrenus TaxID=2482727 RepID=A0A3E2NTE6_9SPHI|nr:kelch repeat-containing protein [Mucilaginibacter terrenus]RFZ84130.1 hypothetical protein DYU05_00385 [Mucilaginibacter terrenus]